jgi:predicted PurR-regulated permease PerM
MAGMTSDADAGFAGRAVDAAIKIGLIALLAVWCLEIVRPFMLPLIWGVIIAIASYQGFVRLERALGGHSRLVSADSLFRTFMVMGLTASGLPADQNARPAGSGVTG